MTNLSSPSSDKELTDQEFKRLVVDYNASAAPYPADKTVVELFEAQVKLTPNEEAARFGDHCLSYSQLNERANQVAAHLRSLGAGPEQLVVLYMEHSIEVLCAILAVLKAGPAYVPVDPASTPAERLAFILQDISQGAATSGKLPFELPFELPLLITQSRLAGSIPSDAARVAHAGQCSCRGFCRRNLQASIITLQLIQKTAASPSNLAYVIYTLGLHGKTQRRFDRASQPGELHLLGQPAIWPGRAAQLAAVFFAGV